MPKQVIEIVKANRLTNKGKIGGFRVRYYGSNGEILAVSEVLNTRANANKNIKAIKALMCGDAQVIDKTKDNAGKSK